MKWIKDITISECGYKIFYKGIEVDLKCENIFNISSQINGKETLDEEVLAPLREKKINMILKFIR
jgi:hypothetical protein